MSLEQITETQELGKTISSDMKDVIERKYLEEIKPSLEKKMYELGIKTGYKSPDKKVRTFGRTRKTRFERAPTSEEGTVALLRSVIDKDGVKDKVRQKDIEEIILYGDKTTPGTIQYGEGKLGISYLSKSLKTRTLMEKDDEDLLKRYIAGRVQGSIERIKKGKKVSHEMKSEIGGLIKKYDLLSVDPFKEYITTLVDKAKQGDKKSIKTVGIIGFDFEHTYL